MSVNTQLPFTIVSCTSFEPGYEPTYLCISASSSRNGTTRGWQSARNPIYPINITLKFESLIEVHKLQLLSHQSKIANQIEIYIANEYASKKTFPYHPAAQREDGLIWTRPGYLPLDSNERSDFKGRELKSVYLDSKCTHMRLSIKGCHPNHLNTYNQVAILAVSVIGHTVDVPLPSDNSLHILPASNEHSPILSKQNSLPIPPFPSLGPSIDPTTSAHLTKLHSLKAAAIEREDYDEAKRIKIQMDRLQRVIGQISEWEQKKRQAIEAEEYDVAKECKRHIDRLRKDAIDNNNTDDHIPVSARRRHPSATQHEDFNAPSPRVDSFVGNDDDRPIKPARQASLSDEPLSPSLPPPSSFDEDRPIRPMKAASQPAMSESSESNNVHSHPINQPNFHDERPIATRRDNIPDELQELPPEENELPSPEPLTGTNRKEAAPLLDIFGPHVVQCLFSRHWQLRHQALLTLTERLSTPQENDVPFVIVSALARVLKRLLCDKTVQVFVAAARLLEYSMEYCAEHRIKGEELRNLVEGVVSAMVERLSSTTARERDGAQQILIYMTFHRLAPPSIVPSNLLAPLKAKEKENPIAIRARAQLLMYCVMRFGVSESGSLSLTSLMKFAVPYFANRDSSVRDSVYNLCSVISRNVGRAKLESFISDLPKHTLDAFEQRLADAISGRVVLQSPEPPTSAYVEKLAERNQPVLPLAHNASLSFDKIQPRVPLTSNSPPVSHRSSSAKLTTGSSSSRTRQSYPPKKPAKKPAKKKENTRHSTISILNNEYADDDKDGSLALDSPNDVDELAEQMNVEFHVEHTPIEEDSFVAPPEDDYSFDKHSIHSNETSRNQTDRSDRPGTNEKYQDADIVDDQKMQSSEMDEQGICQFCGVRDDAFYSEDALDLHYWQSCPMLLSCPHCEQVIEIQTFTEHLLAECESNIPHSICPQCTQAIPSDMLEKHRESSECAPSDPSMTRCPLCSSLVSIALGDEAWRHHILVEGCPNNMRTSQR